MKEADLVIDTELETFELADITFEYMLKKAMIVEEEAW